MHFFLVIVDAIVLMTGKFDKNLVYRHELKDTGDEEPDTLDITLAIIGITIPVVGGKHFTFLKPRIVHDTLR